MATFKDLANNGKGVVLEQPLNTIDLSTVDAIVPGKTAFLRANGAGNVILRVPGAANDITIPAKDGEYIPVQPGTTVRKTGTTVTSLLAMNG